MSSSRWLLVSVPREPLWRGLNLARGSYLRELGNTPGHLNHWSKRRFASLLAPPRGGRRAALAAALDDGARTRRLVSQAGAGESAASYGRGAALLSALIGVTGLLTYAFHSIAAHALGADDYGLIAVLWAAVFLVASVIYRPVEQLLSRTIAERRARERPIGDALRVAATIQLGLAVAFVAVALAAARPDRGRPLLRQLDALLVPDRGGHLLRRELLRARLPGRGAAVRRSTAGWC